MSYTFYYDKERKDLGGVTGSTFMIEVFKIHTRMKKGMVVNHRALQQVHTSAQPRVLTSSKVQVAQVQC